jgi:PiT family inorganic phosphate transporter
MDIAVLIFLCSGLFLGWSLGANDAANVFGTAVGTRMVKFGTAAMLCSIFVVLGAVISGAGASHTLGKLGAVNALPGSFMAAFAAAFTVYIMTRLGLPVSTSQAVVGAIIGWNLFSGFPTDGKALTKIVFTWVACPLLAAAIGVVLFKLTTTVVRRTKVHIVRLDSYTRVGLILAGIFGSYALGANNIANVMGVFVPANPFTSFSFGDVISFSGVQQLFLIGALAIAVGVFTYSKRRRLGRCGIPLHRPVSLRITGTGAHARQRRPADHSAGAGLQLPGGYRRCHRHRPAQGRPGHQVEGFAQHLLRLGDDTGGFLRDVFLCPLHPAERI